MSTLEEAIREMRISVDKEALDAFIGYVNTIRAARDSEFCCSIAEHAESDKEFEQLIAALQPRPTGAEHYFAEREAASPEYRKALKEHREYP